MRKIISDKGNIYIQTSKLFIAEYRDGIDQEQNQAAFILCMKALLRNDGFIPSDEITSSALLLLYMVGMVNHAGKFLQVVDELGKREDRFIEYLISIQERLLK